MNLVAVVRLLSFNRVSGNERRLRSFSVLASERVVRAEQGADNVSDSICANRVVPDRNRFVCGCDPSKDTGFKNMEVVARVEECDEISQDNGVPEQVLSRRRCIVSNSVIGSLSFRYIAPRDSFSWIGEKDDVAIFDEQGTGENIPDCEILIPKGSCSTLFRLSRGEAHSGSLGRCSLYQSSRRRADSGVACGKQEATRKAMRKAMCVGEVCFRVVLAE